MTDANWVFDKAIHLMDEQNEMNGETRTVDVHIQRLRKKLGGDYIETVYKCGYKLKMA